MLLRYELQKVFAKRANQIILLLLALLVAYTCRNALQQVEWIDDQGNSITGHSAAVKLREASEEWSGVLDQELLEKALAALKEIYSSTEIDSKSEESNWILRNKLQGLQEIADLIGWSFGDEYSTFAEMVADLQPEDLSRFYENRIERRKAYLYEDETSWGYYNYSLNEKAYLLAKFESLETPLQVSYHEGWVQANEQISTLLKYAIILLSFILAGIFADEFTLKTDAVYYNTYHGRTKSTIVKVVIGFLIITLAYWLCVGAFSFIVLGNLGTEGANCYVQSHAVFWNTKENITFFQKYLLTVTAGYIGYLFIGFLVMWISELTKSPVLAVLIPSLLIILPEYLWNFYSPTMRRIIGILPDKLLDMETAIQYLYLYTLGDHVVTSIPIILTVYPFITVLLVFLCYRTYRNKQIV